MRVCSGVYWIWHHSLLFISFFLKKSGSESKLSLQSEFLETFELPRSPGSQLEFLDLDVTTSGEPLISFPERQPSGGPRFSLGQRVETGPGPCVLGKSAVQGEGPGTRITRNCV